MMSSNTAYNEKKANVGLQQAGTDLGHLQQLTDHRDDLRRYQQLHLTSPDHNTAPKAPMAPSSGYGTTNAKEVHYYEDGQGHLSTSSGVPLSNVYGDAPTDTQTSMYRSSSPSSPMDQYTALLNAAGAAGGGQLGSMNFFAPGSGNATYQDRSSYQPPMESTLQGQAVPVLAPSGAYQPPMDSTLQGYSVPVLAPSGSGAGGIYSNFSANYSTTAPALATKPAGGSQIKHSNNTAGGLAQTTDVQGDPRSNTITLSTRSLAPSRDGRGYLVEAIDTYTYRRPETTNGEYGNFPKRTHDEHAIDADSAGRRVGVDACVGGPGTAEERPGLERHGNTAHQSFGVESH